MCMAGILRIVCGFILVFIASYIVGAVVSWEWSISAWDEESRILLVIISAFGGFANAM